MQVDETKPYTGPYHIGADNRMEILTFDLAEHCGLGRDSWTNFHIMCMSQLRDAPDSHLLYREAPTELWASRSRAGRTHIPFLISKRGIAFLVSRLRKRYTPALRGALDGFAIERKRLRDLRQEPHDESPLAADEPLLVRPKPLPMWDMPLHNPKLREQPTPPPHPESVAPEPEPEPEPETSTNLPVVFNRGEETLTTSLMVAGVFDKRHDNVMRDIEAILDHSSDLRSDLVFRRIFRIAGNGRSEPMFEMNKDAFSLLAMGFTGAKAMKFKIAYIAEFNRMQQALVAQQTTGQDMTAIIVGMQRTMAEAISSIPVAVAAAMQPFITELREQRQGASSGYKRSADFGFEPPPQPVTTKKKGQTSLRPFVVEAKKWLGIRMPVQQVLALVEDRLVAQGWAERGAPPNAFTKGNLLATPAGYKSGYVVNYQATRQADGVVFPMSLNLTKEGDDYCREMLKAEFSSPNPNDPRQSDFFHKDSDEENN